MLALSFSADAYYYARVGVGKNMILFSDKDWQDQGELGCSFGFGNRHHLKGSFYGEVSYTHYSQCMVGAPFDKKDEDEDSSDHLFYYLEYRF